MKTIQENLYGKEEIIIRSTTWLATNELSDALKALELSLALLDRVGEDSYYWKWVLVTMHNAVQGFMVSALRGEDGVNVLKKSIATKFRAAQASNSSPPKLELDTFLNLYKKLQKDCMLINSTSKKLCPSDHQTKAIRQLNRLRNNFVHFTAKNWTMEITAFPAILLQCLKLIRFLVFSSGNIVATKEFRNKTESLLDKGQRDLSILIHN